MTNAVEFERIPYLTVVAMSPDGAREFFGGSFFKVVSLGQALGPRWRFGAREYRLFRTEADWRQYQAERKEFSATVKNLTPRPDPLASEGSRTAFEIGIAFAQAVSDTMEEPMHSPTDTYRVAVIRWSSDPQPHPYWADSGCGVLNLETAETVWQAGRDAGELCRIVPADSPILKSVP